MPPWSIEHLLRYLRFSRIKPYLPLGGVFVDIGCNDPPYTINKVMKNMDFCIGIDAEIENVIEKNYELKKCFIKKHIPVETELANSVTMLAVLEHLDYPMAIVKECYRILKPGGVLLITVPSPVNEKPLNVLATLGIVQKKMIDQHKNYFSQNELKSLLSTVGFREFDTSSFQLGLNTLVRATK